MATVSVTAPAAPAAWGRPVEPAAMAGYLDRLVAWRDARRSELDELDRAALSSTDVDLTGDVTLAMALWQSVATRYDELARVWDGGRVGPVELARLSSLVWGRAEAAGAAAALSTGTSLPEACRLSDAVTAQLRRRLALETVSVDLAEHLEALRADVERIRDLVDGVPSGPDRESAAGRLERLSGRLEDISARARRGADVGGLVGPLETDAAHAERDLIVAAATRRDDERDLARAQAWRTELVERASTVTAVADECVARVRPAPVLGIPQVDALGPVPDAAADVDAYLARLDAVARALTRAEQAYRAPVAELTDLRGLLDASRAQAAARGRDRYPEVAALATLAGDVLAAAPVDLPRARAVVAVFRLLLESPPPALPPDGAPTAPGTTDVTPGRSS
ncbi:hypothetical protein [Cellulomonas sp. KRMCY2]|uniref:hypothetical protein n=1 Tax=Cellulomonas sp. KRMCY2 TaxID=1304865 RepID=UPI00045EA30A|nr:hypothetical protein [Cellulomonas sp. KRMCY2]